MTRAELDQSNTTKILGPGKVNKVRHSNHNKRIADYIDSNMPFPVTTNESGVLKDDDFVGITILKIERNGIFYYNGQHFTKAFNSDTVTMIPPNTLNNNKSYLITISTII